MWSRSALLLCALLGVLGAHAQEETLTVAFYNVENLFDTIDDAGYDDVDFTPHGAMRWDGAKLRHKADNLGRVIAQLGGGPDIIGLCEIENEIVLEELLHTPALRDTDYDFVTLPSGDVRGIDMAVIFRIPAVKLAAVSRGDLSPGARGVLHAVFETEVGERLHVVVCHMPSVPSGSRRRAEAAEALRDYLERLASAEPGCKILLMGDFNSNPGDRIMSRIIPPGDSLFMNPFEKLYAQGYGSYLYRRRWNMYDNIVVGRSMLSGEGLRYAEGAAHVFVREFIIQREGSFEGYPFRSFSGRVYVGGYSDHLPVYLELIMIND